MISNVGGWMYSAAAGWLMTNLTKDPLTVSLVQVASNAPMLLFALLAGALSDIVNKRHYLFGLEVILTIISLIFAVMVLFNWVSPLLLLLFLFLDGAVSALESPAWQSIVPELVPQKALGSAISANSVGVNISRAIGPAIAGAIIGPWGIGAPFVVNAISNFGVIGALVWWKEPKKTPTALPVERVASAIRVGLRYSVNNPRLGSTLGRAIAVLLFASAYWALLPLEARQQLGGGPELYGLLLGAIGLGAVIGAFWIRAWERTLGADRLVALGSIGTGVALMLFAIARGPVVAAIASLIAGVCWIAIVATLNVSAQIALPEWVRGRGLAAYIAVFFGSLSLGSALWGQVAASAGISVAQLAAAIGLVLAIPLTWRWKLQFAQRLDLTPSMQWPTPVVARKPENDDGPVLVTVYYQLVDQHVRTDFLEGMAQLRRERLRDGAYRWGIYEDIAQPGRFLETFLVESWLEHLRQHERVTKADDVLQKVIHKLLRGEPQTTHLISPTNPRGPHHGLKQIR